MDKALFVYQYYQSLNDCELFVLSRQSVTNHVFCEALYSLEPEIIELSVVALCDHHGGLLSEIIPHAITTSDTASYQSNLFIFIQQSIFYA